MDWSTYHRKRSEIAGLPLRPYQEPIRHHILLGNKRFHYLEWGERGQPCFVFLHGGGQTAWTWDTVCQHLARDFHCLALDLRGHGDSEWAYDHDYFVEAFARDVEAFLENAPERPILVGMSLGGLTAIAHAVDNSALLRGLVCVDVGPEVDVQAAQPIRDFVRDGFALSDFNQFVDAAQTFNQRRHKTLLEASLRRNLRERINGTFTWKTDPNMHRAVDTIAAQMADLDQKVNQIACPVLVLRGAESDILSEQQAARFAATVPDGSWEAISNAGHSIQGDNPKGLIEALLRFHSSHLNNCTA